MQKPKAPAKFTAAAATVDEVVICLYEELQRTKSAVCKAAKKARFNYSPWSCD